MTIMASVTSMPVQGTRIIQANSSFDQVLKSDPVRRLFNQPNIVIHAIPRTDSPTAFRMVSSTESESKCNGEHLIPDTPEDASQMKNLPNDKVPTEEENFLPSKSNGKSEILLVPIVRKRKECGHFEPCESLVCDVDVQQYEDDEGTSPLVAFEIDEDEIDAPATKHCKNEKCDALNIDHDRCRRALILLNRCDKTEICDICKFKFKSKKAHVNHKKCRRRSNYHHHIATSTEVFKVRMREKELQILEAARTKKRIDYFDPVKGFKNTMEALTNNDELIIIPKMPPKTSKFTIPVNTNSLSHSNFNNNIYHNNNNSLNVSNKYYKPGSKKIQSSDSDKELTSEMIQKIIRTCQKSIDKNERIKPSSLKQLKLAEHLNGATVKVFDSPKVPNQERINFPGLMSNKNKTLLDHLQLYPKKSGLPLKSVDFNLPQEQKANCGLPLKNLNKKSPTLQKEQQQQLQQNFDVKGSSGNNMNLEKVKPVNSDKWVLPHTPYKVVPIAELKSEPSLLHHTQGVPKFCVVPDTSNTSQSPKNTKKHISKKNISNELLKTAHLPLILPKKEKKVIEPNSGVLNIDQIRPLQPMISGSEVAMKKLGAKLVKKQRKIPRKTLMKKRKYKCTICQKKFSSIDYCNLHIAKHKNKFNFFCRLCDTGFVDKYIMKKHTDTDHKVGEMRCEMCSCILPSPEELSKHMKSSELEVKRQCTECSENFDTCSSLDIHMRKEHGFLLCIVCKRQITKTKINRHLMFEHSISKNRLDNGLEKLALPPNEKDEVCTKDILELLIVETPLKPAPKIEPVIENKIEADCLAKGRSARRRSSKELFTCSVCERRFENEKQYQIHIANFPRKFTTCSNCGKKFHRKSDCTEHSKTCDESTADFVEQTPKRRKLNQSIVETNINNEDNLEIANGENAKLNGSMEKGNCNGLNLNKEKKFKTENETDNKSEENENSKVILNSNIHTESSRGKIIKINEKTIQNDQDETLKLNQCNNFKAKTVKIVFIKNKLNKEIKIINNDNGDGLKLSKQTNPEEEEIVQIKSETNVKVRKIQKDKDINDLKNTIEIENVNGIKDKSNNSLSVSNAMKNEDNSQQMEDKLKQINSEDFSFLKEKETVVKSKDKVAFDTSRLIASIIQDHNYQSIK